MTFDHFLLFAAVVFLVQIAAAAAMFARRFQRRNHFFLRIALCSLGLLLIAWFTSILSSDLLDNLGFYAVILQYLVLFVLCIASIMICNCCTLFDALFCGIAAYAVQNTLYQITEIVHYSAQMVGLDFQAQRLVGIGIQLIVHVLVYWAAYALLAKNGSKEHYPVSKRPLIVLSCVTLVVVLRVLPRAESVPIQHHISWLLLHVLCCVLSLYILFGMSENSNLKQELQTLQQMWRMKEEYYELSKEITESINIKCHDLRYQIEALSRHPGEVTNAKAFQEIQNAVMIYDAIAKTGNEALDVILTEKCFFCEKNQIKLTYIVDGEKLRFIKPIDLYSIFGNALDNAIEAVMKIEDPAQRIISLHVAANGQILIVTLKNSFSGILVMENELPVTSKKDASLHGFGMKSIQLLTQKYGGEMTFSTANNVFTLTILLPIPETE